MDATEEAPAVIQVPIIVSQEAVHQKTVHVKRKTRHHELVEVDGFVFRRKRKAITPAPTPHLAVMEAPAVSPAAIKLGLQLDTGSPAAAAREDGDTKVDDAATVDQAAARAPEKSPEPVFHNEQSVLDAEAEAAEAEAAAIAAELDMAPATQAPPKPQHFSMAPSELVYMVEWVLISELKKLPGMTAETAQKAAAQIKDQLALQLQQHQADGGAETSEQTAAGERHGQLATPSSAHMTLLPYQVQQLKAALQDKHSKLLQEETAWLKLRQQYSDMHQANPAEETINHDQQPEPAAAAAVESAAGAAPAAAPGQDPAGPVTAQGESTLRSVSLKVEVLTALVAKMEHLISNAEAAARSLQVGYHNEKFKIFPHVNSPAALIKSITQSQLSDP